MNKNNLDKLFRDKLKDFQEVPDERVWESIEESLDQRRKSKRVIPIWWKLGGVAAVLAIALLIINPFGTEEPSGTTITDIEKSDPNPVSGDKQSSPGAFETDKSPNIDQVTTVAEDEKSDFTGEPLEDPLDAGETGIANQSEQGKEKNDSRAPGINLLEREEIVNTTPETTQQQGDELLQKEQRKEVIAEVSEEMDSDLSKEDVTKQNAVTGIQESKETEEVKEAIKSGETEVAAQESTDDALEDQSVKKSIFDEIDQQQEEEALAESSGSKWSVGPTVAPVYFNSFGEGSPIHSNFASNSKSGNINLSYGVAVSYDISDRLKLRSGVHKVDYGYDTNDITFSSSLVASTSTVITNINYTTTSRNLVVENGSGTAATPDFSANDIIAQNPTRNGRMVQEFGYLEIPMELNYSLLDRKLNIDLIGGISSLFLVDNSVTLESSGTSTEMGEANNINDVNFSTNVGLGINYELNDKMKVHLEPMFKYQLNTFSGVEGSFQPYSVGIYTGMSFKF